MGTGHTARTQCNIWTGGARPGIGRKPHEQEFERQNLKAKMVQPTHEPNLSQGRQVIVNLQLREVTKDDLVLIERWLHADHVRSAWGDPDAHLRLLGTLPADGGWRAIIEADGLEVGLVLWQHPTRQELDVAGLTDIPQSAIDIDIMIGEADAVGRGVGSSAIRLVVDAAFSDPAVPFVMACARLDNLASQRTFAKAGFRKDREFDDVPNGRHVLMVRQRQEGRVA